jgi:hypothetical protein
MDDRDREVAGLRAEGYSFRAIATMLGMSLGAVQRGLRRAEETPPDDDDGEVPTFPLDADDDDAPVGSVRFVGVDEFDSRVELFADERGHRFNLLYLYRFTPVDGGVAIRSAMAQLTAAGRR